jgi:hypothetical protein
MKKKKNKKTAKCKNCAYTLYDDSTCFVGANPEDCEEFLSEEEFLNEWRKGYEKTK